MPKIKPFDYEKIKPTVVEATVSDLKETNRLLKQLAEKKEEPIDLSITVKIV